MRKYILGIFVFLFVASNFSVLSQNQNLQDISISLPYLCGFEDTLENNKWFLNAGPDGPNCREAWTWGNRECSEGFNSLYVIGDTSVITEIRAERVKPQLAIAYRPFIIPSSLNPAKSYYNVDVSFEWKGSLDFTEDNPYGSLNVYLLAETYISESELLSSSQGSDLPSKLNNQALALGYLSGKYEWENFLLAKPKKIYPDTKYFLIFVWRSPNAWEKYVVPEPMWVDNIQITSSDCRKPTDLDVVGMCDTLKVSWKGTGVDAFHFEYRPAGSLKWRGKTITKEHNIVISDLKEGAYDVRVRGITGKDTSAWVTYNGAICYCPDRHCINFVELDRPGVICEIGEASNPLKGRPHIEPTLVGSNNAGPIDYGSNSKHSRHTIHWKQNEFDPRIGGTLLRTVPKDALASMRLGNWQGGGEAEGVMFDYTVDTTDASILLLRYAVVLEAPNHGPTQDPYFKLEILDYSGDPVSGKCGTFDFTPTRDKDAWNRSGDYVWRDWTSIGVNLTPYHGQTIQLHLITQDCCMSKHFGYAYFTLDCAHAEISTTSCSSSPYMEMVAPEGFDYIWTRDDDRDEVVGNERTLRVDIGDTHTYYCNVEYKSVKGCGFEMHSSVFTREPLADFDYQIDLSECNCENKVVLINKSRVLNILANGDTIDTSEPCENIEWSINDGEYVDATEKITYILPKEGGELKVHLKADISNGMCGDDSICTISIPPIYEGPDTIYERRCKGETVTFAGGVHGRDSVITEVLKNQYGCDSVTVMDLKFWPLPEDTHVYDTICDTEVYFFNGRHVSETGEYSTFLQTVNGCDSTVFLHLEVIPSIGINVPNEYRSVCADDDTLTIEYQSVEGKPEPKKYSIIFDSLAHRYGFVDVHDLDFDGTASVIPLSLPNPCRPNTYTATIVLQDTISVCSDISVPITFDVYYSSSILQAKFDNLITILDADVNGGYQFREGEYRWYINNELDSSVTSSFYYLSENKVFGTDCYYVEVTRVDDGVVMRSCDICPGLNTPVDDVFDSDDLLHATLFNKNQPIVIEGVTSGRVNVFSLTGQLLNSIDIVSDYTEFYSPQESGIYILQITNENLSKVYKIKVK